MCEVDDAVLQLVFALAIPPFVRSPVGVKLLLCGELSPASPDIWYACDGPDVVTCLAAPAVRATGCIRVSDSGNSRTLGLLGGY